MILTYDFYGEHSFDLFEYELDTADLSAYLESLTEEEKKEAAEYLSKVADEPHDEEWDIDDYIMTYIELLRDDLTEYYEEEAREAFNDDETDYEYRSGGMTQNDFLG